MVIDSHRLQNVMVTIFCATTGEMHHTLCTGQSVWSCFDQFSVAFHGELLGDDVIS